MWARAACTTFVALAAGAAVLPGAWSSAEPPINPNFDIYSIGIHGAGPRQLTTDVADDLSPSVSPDGTTIVYSRGHDLWLMNSDGTNQRLLASAPAHEEYVQPSWSADGRFIVFTAWDYSSCIQWPYHCADPSVLIVQADGGGPRLVQSRAIHPRWSPRGQRLVLAGDVDPYEIEPTSIYVQSVSGNGTLLAHVGSGSLSTPSWSPDGLRVVYTRTNERGSAVYIVRSDRRGSRRLFRGARPEWSPHGDRIAMEDRSRLILIRGHGRPRARRAGWANFFSWNRSGTMLALVDWRLAVIRRDGREFRPLCCAPQHFGFGDDAAAWSRGGGTLFYAYKTESSPPS